MRKQVTELEAKLAEFKQKQRRPAAGAQPGEHETTWIAPRTRSRTSRAQMQALRRERVFLMAQLQQARATGPETATCAR